MKKLLECRYSKYILVGIILALLPLLQQMGILKSSTITILGTVIFYAIVGIGLNVLLGYSGLISLATAGFMGIGAYLSSYLTVDLNFPFILSLVISVIVPLVIGIVTGLISLRISGMYLAIATLVVSEIFRKLFVELDGITGGFSGKKAAYPEFLENVLSRNGTYLFIVVVLVIIMILTDNFINSSTGRAFLTMRISEPAAQAMGINILMYKLMAFGIATAYAALGGVLYVHFVRFAYPSNWTLLLSLQILAVVVIGGIKTIGGPLLGSFIVFGVPELILKRLPVIGNIDGLPYIFTGVLIVVVILFYPKGLIAIVDNARNTLLKRR